MSPLPLPFTQSELQAAVHYALKNWHNTAAPSPEILQNLTLVRQVVDSTNTLAAIKKVLLHALQIVKEHDGIGGNLLHARFIQAEPEPLPTAAKTVGLSRDQAKHRQQEVIEQLAAVLYELESAARTTHRHNQEVNLTSPTYTQLFGTDDHLDQLTHYLQSHVEPWVIAIVGLGGLGKTSLADAAVRRLIPVGRYQQVVWHRLLTPHTADPAPILQALADKICPEVAAPQQIPTLRQLLKSTPYLIVLDNLEVDTAPLLDTLQDWANPSKFLLTSRHRLPPTAVAHSLTLRELPFEAAVALIHEQASRIGELEGATFGEEILRQIYAAVGGNPLALKLVIGLTKLFSFSRILDDLTAAHITDIEGMYRHIYWQAWHSLPEDAQHVLEVMPIASSELGFDIEDLQRSTPFTAAQILSALSQLTARSLVEIRGTTWERRYGLHRLTESFLRTEIIHWPEEMG